MANETGRLGRFHRAVRGVFGLSCVLAAATLALLTSTAAQASDSQAKDYRAPTGFNGHPWKTPFHAFKGFHLLAANTALASHGKVVSLSFDGRICGGPGPCLTPNAFALQTEQIDGAGSFALAEYYFDSEPHPWAGKGIDLYTVSYLFCASSKTYLPKHIKDALALCGARVMFQSDDLNAQATRPAGYVTNERRILQQLINEHGEPPNFQRHGRILIDPNGDELWPVEPQAPVDYVLYRWCGLSPSARLLHPSCPSTVTFVFNETRGVGMVLYATNPVYDYAYARHMTGDDNNDVYVILNSPRLDLQYQRVLPHVTSHLPTQQMTAMTPKEYREFEP
ncbi:MAG TPA: hypothetical protein VGM84_07700 [Steroidobacteraceae bacterium]|jgi:hypothetical protein